MRVFRVTAAVIATAALAAACTETGGEGTSTEGGQEPVTQEVSGTVDVALIIPETGPLAATVGDALKTGTEVVTEMWNEEHPDRKINLTTCNDEGNPERAISCVNRLSSSADLMLGPMFGATYTAAEPMLGIQQIAVTHTPHALPPADKNIFQVAVPTAEAMSAAIEYMKENGFDKFGLLTSTDTTGLSAREAGLEAAEEAGIGVVDQQFDPAAQNLTPQASRLAGGDVDAVFIWSSGSQVVTALRGLHSANLGVPVFLNYSSMSYKLMELSKDVLPKELLFTGSPAFEASVIDDRDRRERLEEFTRRYTELAGVPPDWMGYTYGDVFLVGMNAALHGQDLASMKRYLEEGPPIEGFHAVWDYSSSDHIGVGSGGDSPVLIQRWTGEGWASAE